MERKEEILEAARNYVSSISLSSPSNVIHFEAGAKWADEHINLKSLWHDTSEEPKEETWILATNEKDIIDVYHLRKGRKYNFDGNLIDWSKFVVNFNLTKWAYIDDLLPKGGRK